MIKWLLTIVLVVAGLIIGISLFLQPNSFVGCSDAPQIGSTCDKADAIVVVSGGDTNARTQAGIDLYNNGWADYLVLSGAALDKSGPSNAAAMKLQAQNAGVPAEAILIDENSANTKQNAENTQSIIKERAFQDIILVTSGYHQRRASLEFHKQVEGVTIRNYPVQDADWGWYWWTTPRGWWLAGGEIGKIVAFYLGISS